MNVQLPSTIHDTYYIRYYNIISHTIPSILYIIYSDIYYGTYYVILVLQGQLCRGHDVEQIVGCDVPLAGGRHGCRRRCGLRVEDLAPCLPFGIGRTGLEECLLHGAHLCMYIHIYARMRAFVYTCMFIPLSMSCVYIDVCVHVDI